MQRMDGNRVRKGAIEKFVLLRTCGSQLVTVGGGVASALSGFFKVWRWDESWFGTIFGEGQSIKGGLRIVI
uniref:Uncharacterized protein n=1 Tax=Globodera pallida TaxID=36090 RepID=A0A183C8S7_GLOPA